MANAITCPACNYTRRPVDAGIVPDWECPGCQKAYSKSVKTELPQQSSTPVRSCPDYIQVSITGDNQAPQLLFNNSQDVDEIAFRTKWSPVMKEQTGMDNRELIPVSADRVEFRCTITNFVLGLGSILMGLFCAIHSIGKGMIAFGLGILFIITGFFIFYKSDKLMAFDKGRGVFWKGRRSGNETPNNDSDLEIGQLADIHAIQLIYGESLTSTNNGSSKWAGLIELNLVLSNGDRVNVSVYERNTRVVGLNFKLEKKPREDAMALGKFLGKPVWDAIDSTRQLWDEERM